MLLIRGPDQVRRIVDPEIRRLVEERFTQVVCGDNYDPEIHGEMIVVEAGDTLATLEKDSGCPIASNPFDDARWPDPGFVPACEYLEDHSRCYELLFLFSDDGAGTNFIIPKQQGVDPELLALCARYAVPVATSP